MFMDLSALDIVALMGLNVVLFGPDKLPHAAAQAARLLRQVRQFTETSRKTLRSELGPEFDGLTLDDLNPSTFLRNQLQPEAEQLRALATDVDVELPRPAAAQDILVPTARD